MIEFEIDGKQFRFDKLTAMQQFHVSRKIAPLIPPLLPVLAEVSKDEKKGKNIKDDIAMIGPLLQPFADGLATMSDEASEFVFSTCLGAIWYNHDGNWIKFWTKGGNAPMVAELNDVSLMLRLVVRVIQESLSPFLAAFRTNEGAEEPPEPKVVSVPSRAVRTGS